MAALMNKLGWVLAGVLALLVLAAAARLAFGGPLDPPVSVGTPTGKVQINSLPYTISSPGSYILNADLTCSSCTSGQDGITIAASQVTIDLNGFEINGVPGSGSGIKVSGSRGNIQVKNGTVQNWAGLGGVVLTDAASNTSVNTIVEDLRVSGNEWGISCHVGTVRNNRVHSNDIGIRTVDGCHVVDNDLSANITFGIDVAGNRNLVDGNHVDGGAYAIITVVTGPNTLVRNIAGNTSIQTYSFAAGYTAGPLEQQSTPLGNPWANIRY
jgi:hypothetical protein